MPNGKRLKDILVADLRKELSRRNLDSSGTKQVMLDRLKKVLLEENEDLDEWRFDPTASESNPDSATNSVSSVKNTSSSVIVKSEEQAAHCNQISKTTEQSIVEGKEVSDSGSNTDCLDGIALEVIAVDKEKSNILTEKNDITLNPDSVPAVESSAVGEELVSESISVKKTSRSSSPAIECSLVVGMADGTSELDRELLDFQGSNNASMNSKVTSESADKIKHNTSESSGTTKVVNKACNQIWVNNIASETKAIILKSIFSKHGKVHIARIVKKSYSGGSRFCGFVEMSSRNEADNAICALHKTSLNGNLIFCVRGDKKRTEDIISSHKPDPEKHLSDKIQLKLTDTSDSRLSATKSKATLETNRTEDTTSYIRRTVQSSNQQMTFIERKTQMLKALERRVRRREFDLKHNEAKLRDIQHQYNVKLKELETERDVLREAHARFARERAENERRNEEKISEIRAYENRLIRAEGELRAAQEQQQRYYEAERLRQQKLAAYDEELRKQRHELRRTSRRDKSLSPTNRRRTSMIIQNDGSPKHHSSLRRHVDRDDGSSERYLSNDRNKSNWSYNQNSSIPLDSSRSSGRRNFSSRMSFVERETTPPRKLKKTVDYHRSRIEQSGLEASATSNTDTDLRRRDLSSGRYSSSVNEYNRSWRQQRSPPLTYRSNNKLSDSSQQRHQYIIPSSSSNATRFDAYTLMLNEISAITARAGSNAAAALSTYNTPQMKYTPGSFGLPTNLVSPQQSTSSVNNSASQVDRQRYS